ncbi:MAG: hypothetical protein JNM93_01700 [Bacteriovoracaceae bacterium]|nr:hypothetical protein [Bacteriovoracaceae bacterium]
MKNKILLYNFKNKINADESLVRNYEIEYRKLPINEYALAFSQGIIVYEPPTEFNLNQFDYYRKILIIDNNTFEQIQSEPTQYFDEQFGRQRLVNPKQFKIVKGSIVRSKIDHRLGAGVVLEILKDDMIFVHFSQAATYYAHKNLKCHKSSLRVITHIEEVKNEAKKSI